MAAARILVVDDEPDIREVVKDILDDEGFEVALAADGAQAREARGKHRPDLILLDVWMPDIDGISLLREWGEAGALDCPVVMMSGHGTVETAVEATRLGAFDFIEKPVSMAKLLVTVKNSLEAGRLKRENEQLRRQGPEVTDPIGRGPAVQELRRCLERVAGVDSNVLIIGEAGVGKEQAARWIHAHSSRAEGPFVVAAARGGGDWQELLLDESSGLIPTAQGGTLFLDDVSRLPKAGQEVLLGALESARLPGDTVNIRLIAGTGQPLEERTRSGEFDEDLYYLLNTLPVEMPPLRERREDIPELVRFYAEHISNQAMLPYRRVSVAAQNRLRNHAWPGNLRELCNLIQRLLVLGGEDEIGIDEVEEALDRCDTGGQASAGIVPEKYNMPLREAREAFERDYLVHQLKAVGGSVGKLAETVEMERTHLYRKLRQLGIDAKQVVRER